MSRFAWLAGLLARLQDEHILTLQGPDPDLAPAQVLRIDPEDWGRVARVAAGHGCRWAGLWVEQRPETLLVSACLEQTGDYLVLRTEVPTATPLLPSHTPHFPAADRFERHAQDLLGVVFTDHPDARRWTRHKAWPDTCFPLRHTSLLAGEPLAQTPPDADYPFLQAQGAGVYEIPVGPVHAGIIEPGHFRFQAVGEDVLHLEERLGYVHKGIEKLAEGRDPAGLARLAGRVSGDSTVSHAWAACMAMEAAAGVAVPPRALGLRALLAERERIANHLGDIGAICNDVGFGFAYYQFGRLRELWQRASARAFGHRLLMDRVVPGGVAVDPDAATLAALRQSVDALRRELGGLYAILGDYPSLEDRLLGTGVLSPALAARLGALGYLGRASGQDRDLRRDLAYPPYDGLVLRVPVLGAGDVAARLQVRMEEVLMSLDLHARLSTSLADGPVRARWPAPAPDSEGLGLVEGWRGEVLSYVRFGADGRVARFFPRDPSWFSWPALEQLILGNIVPDFPVCNKSVNGSYSGQDL